MVKAGNKPPRSLALGRFVTTHREHTICNSISLEKLEQLIMILLPEVWVYDYRDDPDVKTLLKRVCDSKTVYLRWGAKNSEMGYLCV